jgi:hypothetical protein
VNECGVGFVSSASGAGGKRERERKEGKITWCFYGLMKLEKKEAFSLVVSLLFFSTPSLSLFLSLSTTDELSCMNE